MVVPAIGLDFGNELGMMPVDAAIHHYQEFARRGRVRGHGVLKNGVVLGKEIPGEVHGITEVHLDVLLDGGQGRHGPVSEICNHLMLERL